MTSFDADSFARGLRELNDAEKRQIAQRLTEARAEAARLIDRLQRQAGCAEVVLFGSVADGSVRNLNFDIDLAIVEGDLFGAVEIAEQSPFAVDVIDYNNCPDHVRASIDRHR